MTDSNRLNEIEKTILEILQDLTSTILNEESAAQKRLKELNPTTKEFLALANKPQKLPETFDVMSVLEMPTEDNRWEEAQRAQKEYDELASFVEAKEAEEAFCTTCGSECISYNQDGETHWLCEECYYGNQAQEIGYCGFPCGFGCPTCDTGGYDGADEI